MTVLWNPGGQTIILKRNMTIDYVKESDYMEKDPTEELKNLRKITATLPLGNIH